MKKILTYIFFAALSLCMFSCREKIEYVTPDWVELNLPEEGYTILLGSPDELLNFSWKTKEGATYEIAFDKTHKFENPVTFALDTASSYSIKCKDMLEILRSLDPEFLGKETFFWNLTETRGSLTQNCWRFFNAVYAAGSFTDPRDGVEYNTIKYEMANGDTYEFMTDNLKATVYSDNGLLKDGVKYCAGAPERLQNDPVFVGAAGCYYSFNDAVRMTWDEAKAAYEAHQQIQGICPDGWHVPSYDEWDNTRAYFGGYEKSLVNIITKEYWTGIDGITNDAQFNVIPTGRYNTEEDEKVAFCGERCSFWSSTPVTAYSAYSWGNFFETDQPGLAMTLDVQDNKDGIYAYYHGTGENGCDKCFCVVRCIRNYSVN